MIVIKKAKDKQFYFVILSKNNKILVTSETYDRLDSVKKGITALKKAVFGKTKLDIKTEEK